MNFTKMQGAGNDFIIINNMDSSLPCDIFSSMSKRLCTRRLSIGADGLMVLVPSEKDADFKMLFYNSDGSLGEMCGNGARCICRYAYEKKISGIHQTVETTAGLVYGDRISEREYRIQLNDPTLIKNDMAVTINGDTMIVDYVELGDPAIPHCIVTLPHSNEIDFDQLRPLAKSLRNYTEFPKGANVNFVIINSNNELTAATFERGVEDFTYACGTGCGSIVTALSRKGIINNKNVSIQMPGGLLSVSVELDDNKAYDLYLTGPTNIVCEGTITDEDFDIEKTAL